MGTKVMPYQIEGFYYITGKQYIVASNNVNNFTVSWLFTASVIKATLNGEVIIEGVDFSVDNTIGKVTMLKSNLSLNDNLFFIYTYPAT